MSIQRRIFVSGTINEKWITPEQKAMTDYILGKIKQEGYTLEQFFKSGDSTDITWSFDNVEKIMRKCVGCIVIAFPRWMIQKDCISSEYINYEGAVANAFNIPLLILSDSRILSRGILSQAGGKYIFPIAENANLEWLDKSDFHIQFDRWISTLKKYNDIFFGYCGQATSPATSIYRFLTGDLNVRVHDWQIDNKSGRTILEEIESALYQCAGGIFLFTKDDQDAPRDNVVLETGMFIQAKGKEKVLIIRETGAKVPADLGGVIYLDLPDRNNTAQIETGIRRFIERNFS
ncbi:MAG: TIR domain-containing protein [Chryseolinea sp.]